MSIVSRLWVPLLVAPLLVSCTGDAQPPRPGGEAPTAVEIAVGQGPGTLDPAAGYAPYGAAKVFDGLVEHQGDGLVRPALASGMPQPSADGLSWVVGLRTDVSFSDGSAFDAVDVVQTYRALSGPVKERFWMLSGVEQLDAATVRFSLARPFPDFASLLVVGIRAAEKPDQPVGTGPYTVAEWQPGARLVLKANPGYFGGEPKVKQVTVEFVPDDEARAKRLRDGKVDSAALPVRLADGFERADNATVVRHRAADLRAVTLPGDGPVSGDPAIRLALNLAVDRQALVDSALGGAGVPTSMPLPRALAEFQEPGARFDLDINRAKSVLDAAGWVPGPDGVRARGGVPATFSVGFRDGDTEARDLVRGFAGAAGKVGIKVTPEPGAEGGSSLIAFGDPFDPDPPLNQVLRPSGGEVAAALDNARGARDPGQRAVAFRAVERLYRTNPPLVVLAEAEHAYVLGEDWTGAQPVVEGTGTDHTWGAWWNLQRWEQR